MYFTEQKETDPFHSAIDIVYNFVVPDIFDLKAVPKTESTTPVSRKAIDRPSRNQLFYFQVQLLSLRFAAGDKGVTCYYNPRNDNEVVMLRETDMESLTFTFMLPAFVLGLGVGIFVFDLRQTLLGVSARGTGSTEEKEEEEEEVIRSTETLL